MTGPTLVVFVGVLVSLLLAIVAALVWQEGRKRSFDTVPAYVIDDVIDHIRRRLSPDVLERLGNRGVEQVVDWEVRYMLRDGGPAAVAGGTDASVSYIVERIAHFHGVSYAPEDVRAVLALEAEYLMAAGAIGDRVVMEGDGEA
jgi:hypothetical protein